MKLRLKKKRKLLLLFLILLIILGTIYILRSNVFAISNLEVETEKINCTTPEQIKDQSGILEENFFFINYSKVENDLKKKFICIRNVDVSRYFPKKVKLFVAGREPAALLVASNEEATESAAFAEASPSAEFNFAEGANSENFTVDHEGVVYSSGFEQINVPTIYISSTNLKLGQKLDYTFGNALKILEKVKSFGLEIKGAKIYSNELLLVNSIPRMIFKIANSVDTQIASLQLILEKAKIDSSTLEFIDLRFDKPIVRFAPKKN